MRNRLSALRFLREEFLRLGLPENEAEAEAREALFHTLQTDALGFALSLQEELTEKEERETERIAAVRRVHMPLAYILGERYFMGRPFYVDKSVLIPRWETELLCRRAAEIIRESKYERALDLCTGSGCVAVTVALEAGISVDGADISAEALPVAEENAKRHHAKARFFESDLFANIIGEYPLIMINPPYISEGEYASLEAQVRDYEPALALKAGEDGLFYYRKIAEQAGAHLKSGGTLLLEIGSSQGERVAGLFRDFKNVRVKKDYNGFDRMVEVNKG